MDDVEVLSARIVRNEFTPHYHEGYSFGVILRGRCRFESGGQRHVAEAGDVFVIEPYVVHAASCPDEMDYRVVYCSPERLRLAAGGGATGPLGLAFPDVVYSARDASTSALGHAVVGVAASGEFGALEPVLCAFAARYGRPGPSSAHDGAQGHVARALALIDASVAERVGAPLCFAAVAAEVGITQAYLNRLFRRAVGLPPSAYVRQRRLQVAKALIRSGADLAGAAADAGFADQSHMTREFRRIQGVTPSAVARA